MNGGTGVHPADGPYVISDERLAEIRAMLRREASSWQILPSEGTDIYDLTGAVYDLLTERDERG